jgi:DNA repair protein RadC
MIVERVLKNGANSVIIAHNHPSGIAIPSVSDAEATVNIKRLLAQVGVNLVDHVVLEENDYVSMAQSAEYTHIF